MNARQSIKVVIVGQGYVGLPLAMAAVDAGYSVVGIDSDEAKVSKLRSGYSPVGDVSSAELQLALDSGRYYVSNDYAATQGFEVAVVSVPTPLKNGEPDLGFIESAAELLAPTIRPSATVILESTTYPGTTEELFQPILESGSGLKAGQDFFLGYSPERIDPGNPKWNLRNTPKVVSGIDQESLTQIKIFYESLGIETVPVSGTREAELTKLLENTFRHVNIALVNELAMFSDKLGLRLWESIEAASTKPFGFMKFAPGPGVGGHCLPVDPSYLSWAVQEKADSVFRFVALANEVNDAMPIFVVDRANQLLAESGLSIMGAKVLIVGLAYKPGTGDLREAPSLVIAQSLKSNGAEVAGKDSFVSDNDWPAEVERIETYNSRQFDLSIIVTNHPDEDILTLTQVSKIVLDTRNCVEGTNVRVL